MLVERDILIHLSTIYRWLIEGAPLLRNNARNINSCGRFHRSNLIEPTLKLTENGFIFTELLINTETHGMVIVHPKVTIMSPMNFSKGY